VTDLVEGGSHRFVVDLQTVETKDRTFNDSDMKFAENFGICRLVVEDEA